MRSLKLNDQTSIPILGLGTWQLKGQSCIDSVLKAFETGYRHIDTADMYGNHKEVAEGIKKSGLKRAEIFITTKIPGSNLHSKDVKASVERYLQELEIDYIDLLLIHWPNRQIPIDETLNAMNDLKINGKVKALGVSNFTIHHMEDALATGVEFTTNQVELHPTFNQNELVDFCNIKNITVTAYSPIARGADLELEAVVNLAKKYDKTPSQIILAWIMQRGIIAIPKSANPKHIEDNFGALEITLSEEDMSLMNDIPQEDRLVNPSMAEFDY